MSQTEQSLDGTDANEQVDGNDQQQSKDNPLLTVTPEDIDIWSKFGFRHEADAYKFYCDYANRNGFGIRIHDRLYRENRSRVVKIHHYNRYVCSKEGYSVKSKENAVVERTGDSEEIRAGYENLRQRKETRCGCTAFLLVQMVDEEGLYRITKWEGKYYDHEAVPGSLAHLMPSNKRVNLQEGVLAELNESVGVKLNTSYRLIFRGAGGVENVGCLKVDLRNHLHTRCQHKIGTEEEVCVQQHLMKTARDNPGFFYEIQYDLDDMITNIFWADHRMRVDYSLFGNAIIFDTTYRTNRTYRPLGLFAGFNHHRQIIVFGSALLFDETIPSFEWLFKTFIRCMNIVAPKTMFIDQDVAMSATLKSTLPRVKHNLCTWHILQNTKSNQHNSLQHPISHVLNHLMYHAESEAEFNSIWARMMSTYFTNGPQLCGFSKSKTWLLKLREKRKQWANAWVVKSFTAGIKSTQASESINSTARLFLKVDQRLSDFFPHFIDDG